jgi:hypothetical protein
VVIGICTINWWGCTYIRLVYIMYEICAIINCNGYLIKEQSSINFLKREKIMSKIIIKTSLSLMFALPLIASAATQPTVSLKTTSLGYPYTSTFDVSANFSQPVMGLDASQVLVTNGSVQSITGSGANYVMVVAPSKSGQISISIPEGQVKTIVNNQPTQGSAVLNITGLDPLYKPSYNFGLQNWNLTMPIPLGNSSSAMMIKQPTLSGIASENSGYTKAPYFFTDTLTGAMIFFAPLNGGTTSSSNYARTEFSEILNWTVGKFSSNEMVASVSVGQVPPSKKIVIGQIHHKAVTDANGKSVSAKPLLKIMYDLNKLDPNKNPCNGCIYEQVRTIPGTDKFLKIVNLAKNIPLNQIFIYRVNLLKDGTLTVAVNDTSTLIKVNTSKDNTLGWGMQDLYFKAGVYNIDNGTSNTAGGRDSFYSLAVSHKV